MLGKIALASVLTRLRGNRSRLDLSMVSGVSAGTIEKLEDGSNQNPKINTLLAICGALGANPIELLKEAYPDLSKVAPIVKKDPNALSIVELNQLINGYAQASYARRALVLLAISHARGDSAKHFRERGFAMTVPAATKLRELLGEIEKLITDDQIST